MAAIIKSISCHSVEAVNLAINTVLRENKQQFEENLKKLADVLDLEPPTKKKTPVRRYTIPSSQRMFNDQVLPQIRAGVEEYNCAENKLVELKWNINLSFVDELTNNDTGSLEDLKKVHSLIIGQEKTANNIHLIVAYHRGLLYLRAREFVGKEENMKEWYVREFNVAYITVHRYQLFALLINAYPRLLVCRLSFTQLTKHHDNILKHLAKDRDLADKLGSHATISVQGKGVDIEPGDMESVPRRGIPLSVDPDFVYERDEWVCGEEQDTEEEMEEMTMLDSEDFCEEYDELRKGVEVLSFSSEPSAQRN